MFFIILSNNGNKLLRYNPLKGYMPKFFFLYLILLRLSKISLTESILLNMTIYFPAVFPLNRSPQVSGRTESCPALFFSISLSMHFRGWHYYYSWADARVQPIVNQKHPLFSCCCFARVVLSFVLFAEELRELIASDWLRCESFVFERV